MTIGVFLKHAKTFEGHFVKALAALVLSCALLLPQPASADAKFQKWIRDFWPTASKAGISANTYNAAFANITTPDPAVLKAARFQPEFVKPIWEYLDSAASKSRVKNGKESWGKYKKTLRKIEKKYGVDPSILVAIWGMESSYGAILDNPKIVRGTIRSLATLAYGDRKRSKFGRTQLVAALKILQNGDVTPNRMTGSWAGAMGHTQFIPTSYQAYAQDFDGDGRRNIWTSPPDALASAANLLKENGWEKGKGWGYEVRLPRGFNYAYADGKSKRSLREWSKLGIQRVSGKKFPRPRDDAFLLLPAGANGPAFLMLKNFNVIKRYNNATSYALGVGHLADKLKGFGEFKASWPRDERPLTFKQRKELQTLLVRKGFLNDKVDGKIGPNSRAAIRAYQKQAGLVPDGFATTRLLSRLQGAS